MMLKLVFIALAAAGAVVALGLVLEVAAEHEFSVTIGRD
jgi:hypothetical protein